MSRSILAPTRWPAALPTAAAITLLTLAASPAAGAHDATTAGRGLAPATPLPAPDSVPLYDGLAAALEAQGRDDEAQEARTAFARTWGDADVELTSSRL